MDLDAELDDSSSSSEEEDDGTTEPKEWQDQFLKVIPLLAKKDASLKETDEKIFPDKEIDKTKKEKEEKPFTLKDYVRGRALEAMKNGEEGDVFGSDDEMVYIVSLFFLFLFLFLFFFSIIYIFYFYFASIVFFNKKLIK